MSDTATVFARTCDDLRRVATKKHEELQRAQAALAAAHCPQGTAEELGDAVCRLAGERDEARAALATLRKSLQLPETASTGELLRVVLHLAAKHAAKQEAAQ